MQLVELRVKAPETPPVRPDWHVLEKEARKKAEALLPGLEPPRTGLAWHKRGLASRVTAARNYLENRRRAKAGREDFRPLYFIWTALRACNFTCTYCDDHRGERYPELENDGQLDTAQAVRLMQVMRSGTPSVYFAGGEPTMRNDLPEITRAARDLDYFPIIVNTNGSLIDRRLKQPAWRSWLADVDIIVVSLDALEEGELKEMWDYKRPHQVIENLLLLRELAAPMRVKLMINCVIQPGKVGHAREVFEMAERLGIWFCPVPVNVGPRVCGELSSDPEYLAFAHDILAAKARGAAVSGSPRMLRRLLFSEPLDCRNALKPHVDHDGKLFWPCKACVNVEPELIDVLAFDDVDALYEHAVAKVDPTRFHGPARNQCGADCNWAQNYSTDTYAHGLESPMSLVGEVMEFLG